MPMQACFEGKKVQPLDRKIQRNVRVVYDIDNQTKISTTVSPEESARRREARQEEQRQIDANGRPSTHLKNMLASMGIHEAAGCQCKQIARMMDVGGPDWCEENIESIVDKMETEAKRRRSLLFTRGIAKMLIRRAVRKARKEIQTI